MFLETLDHRGRRWTALLHARTPRRPTDRLLEVVFVAWGDPPARRAWPLSPPLVELLASGEERLDEERLKRFLDMAQAQLREPDQEEPGFVDLLRGLERSAEGLP